MCVMSTGVDRELTVRSHGVVCDCELAMCNAKGFYDDLSRVTIIERISRLSVGPGGILRSSSLQLGLTLTLTLTQTS